MKAAVTIFFLILSLACFSQEDPVSLSKQLTEGKNTELEKVKSIFEWIVDNIAYKIKSPTKKIIGPASFKNYIDVDEDAPLKPVNERVSENVLRKREAVCDGYARLFTTLCDYAGIRSEIILGYARANSKSWKRFSVNHYWNSVQIDGKWYLLDATWASGYVSNDGYQFIKSYDPAYFLASPREFIKDHFPDDPRWTLLEEPEVPDEFHRSPFKQKSFTKYSIRSFYPSTGIIETFVGDTIRLTLQSSATERDKNICPDLLFDSTFYTHSPSWVFLKPEQVKMSNEIQYSFTVSSPEIKWLYLMYNEDVVLRYKVNVNRKKSTSSL